MTKKDFELVAATVAALNVSDETRLEMAEAFADRLASENARFDRSRFIGACGAVKTVRNLMSGKEIKIAADTPRSCDPSSELYWSM